MTQESLTKQQKVIDFELVKKLTNSLTKKEPDLVIRAFRDEDSREKLKKIAMQEHPELNPVLLEDLMAEVVGSGFIERVIAKEPDVTDIRYNGTNLTIKTNNRKYIYDDELITEKDVVRVIKRFANATDNDFTEKDTRLNAQFEYMRVNAVHKKNAPYGTTMAIRISRPKIVVTEDNFTDLADSFILDLCKLCMHAGTNIILSGKPGSGKTELTKTLMGFLDFKDVIITIEDTPEGHFKTLYPHLDITSWYTNNNLSESDLIDEALRNDCDWLMVTETRTAQAAQALFKGLLTGAKGITSIHSGSAKDIPSRYYNMIKSEIPIDKEAFYDDFYRTVNLGFHQDRVWVNGKIRRYITEIVEFTRDGRAVPIYERWIEGGVFYSETPNPLSEELQNKLLLANGSLEALEGTGLLERIESYSENAI